MPSGSRLAITSTPPSPLFWVTVVRYPIARSKAPMNCSNRYGSNGLRMPMTKSSA